MIRPVGDVFQDGKVTLKVVEGTKCNECYYHKRIDCQEHAELIGKCDYTIFQQIPTKNTESQENQVINYLESGKSITQLEALNMFDCMRLSARVHRLKKRGHNIKTLMVSENGKHFAKYYL